MDWINCPPIPPRSGMVTQFGLAGPLAGVDGNWLMVAGGANFENGMPWRGGAKTYHDDIYLLEEKSDGVLSWKVSEEKLPFPLAYPACITMNNGFISVGGENEKGPVKSVFRYTFAGGKVKIESLPELPHELSSAGATLVDGQVFVVGGLDKAGATAGFYSLSLSRPGEGWHKLPDVPVELSHAVVVAQDDGKGQAVYVIGGRNRTGDVTTFLSSVYKFSLTDHHWTKEGDVKPNGSLVKLSAGTGVAHGNDQIILFGGDRGFFFNQTERMNLEIDAETDPVKKDSLLKRKDYFLTHHPGFSNQILSYHTISKKWYEIGTIPGESPATTVVFQWRGKWVIPSGEIRPGVRTDKVIMVEIK
ncbi:MAG: hypothetical protein M1445_14020 [Bacteroidetes bacterium]|nr:hypothetical protein [Bacteroidota bacterium]